MHLVHVCGGMPLVAVVCQQSGRLSNLVQVIRLQIQCTHCNIACKACSCWPKSVSLHNPMLGLCWVRQFWQVTCLANVLATDRSAAECCARCASRWKGVFVVTMCLQWTTLQSLRPANVEFWLLHYGMPTRCPFPYWDTSMPTSCLCWGLTAVGPQ